MDEILSRIVAELFGNSKGGDELPAKINHLREEIQKVIENENTVFGKFRKLLASFEEIIPDEKQRYHAALKALSTTSKLSRDEIIQAVNNQLGELKILEKGLMPARSGWRDELAAMEAKARGMRDELAKLRERIAQLENEEKTILHERAAREKAMELMETSMAKLFAELGSEISAVKKRIEEFTSEAEAAQPILPRDAVMSSEPEIELNEPSAQPGAESQKKCPMCGGRMNFHAKDELWMCYSCAHEESTKGSKELKIEFSEPSAPQDTDLQKKCPMCGGQLNYLSKDELWMCYSCAYQETKNEAAQRAAAERGGERDTSDKSQPSGKKKSCPVCRKKMDWYDMEQAWRCPFCDYERRI